MAEQTHANQNQSKTDSSSSTKLGQDQGSGKGQEQTQSGSGGLRAKPGDDTIRDTLSTALSGLIDSVEPELHRLAQEAATEAFERSKTAAEAAFQAVKRRPIYLVGIGSFLLFGFAAMFTAENRKMKSSSARDAQH
jgi:hypothetical protein